MIYSCCTDDRRAKLRNGAGYNGIDYLRVLSGQKVLEVHFFHDATSSALAADNFRIDGGERITPVRVTAVGVGSDATLLRLTVDRPGDFSTYTLRLVKGPKRDDPPDNFDPLFAAVPFSFKVECPSDFDCKPQTVCVPAKLPQPQINYLSKDYATFRQLILDRLALLMPAWNERHPADLGVALAEVLAYVGDYLSYRQDAVATEAYLGTARLRTSVRRHARLVDYPMHEGCNASVWIQVNVKDNPMTLGTGTQLITKVAGVPAKIAPKSPEYDRALQQSPLVFETKYEAHLFPALNRLTFYTFGERRCCLPRGATRATLRGWYPALDASAVLIFEEVCGPQTGEPGDANPTRRHAVKLTAEPDLTTDELYDERITNIEWSEDDALPFPLCISNVAERSTGTEVIADVSVARGNVVLADHGRSVEEDLPVVPKPTLLLAAPESSMCDRSDPTPVPVRFRPALHHAPVTVSVPSDNAHPPKSARAATTYSPQLALADMSLTAKGDSTWKTVRDLLACGPDDKRFVVEFDNDGAASLRFGDGEHGFRPDPGTQFHARYRAGSGTVGNAGADTIVHIVTKEKDVESVRNPLPASGGAEREPLERVRQSAPVAFRTQERAVTLEDYGEMAARDPAVQKAAAIHRWTGSWRTVYLTVDALGGEAQPQVLDKVRRGMDKYRLAGRDLEVQLPRFVSLEIDMSVCVEPDHFRSDVEQVLYREFSNRVLPDGRLGMFHPDNLTFGQPVYLSELYAAAQRVEGVRAVQITTCQRQGAPSREGLERGMLAMHPLEIARLDNDPNFPEHGVFRLKMLGGK